MKAWLAAVSLAVVTVVSSSHAQRSAASSHASAAQQRATLFVEWGGSWWAAEEMGRREGLHLIHYIGWDDSYDETVPAERMQRRALKGAWYAAQGGSWWAVQRLGVSRDGRVRVHYVGWGSEWDETVEPERLLQLQRE